MGKNVQNLFSDLIIESAGNRNKHRKLINIKQLKNRVTRYSYSVKTAQDELELGKDKGDYILFDCESLLFYDNNLQRFLTSQLKYAITNLIKKSKITVKNALIVGLGNKNMMADCLGDRVINKVFTTRHLIKNGFKLDEKFCCVSTYSCNVFGKSGIESAEVIKKLTEIVSPDLVIVIDTFVSNSIKRLGKSVQISSCGISPGAGVGNYRKDINFKYLKLPVFSIGVPLLISAETLSQSTKNNKLLKEFVVMNKEIEKDVKYFSTIIANAINLALHKNVTLKEINELMY